MNHKKRDHIYLGIVCPMANERDVAERSVTAVLDMTSVCKRVTFFAVLDNVSRDGTRDLLEEMTRREQRLQVVWSPENRCVVDAYIRGYKEALQAGCDWILEIDAGFSHQPEDIPAFLEKIEQGYDCVFGSRFCMGGAMAESILERRIISRGGTILANLLLGTKLKDMTSGFEMFTRQAMEMILQRGIHSCGHFFQTEIKAYCRRLNIAIVPIYYRAPTSRVGDKVLKDALSNLMRLWRLRLEGKL